MKKKYSKKRGPVRAKKTKYDGIQFASGLEVYMYKALKEAQIVAEYEPTSYTLMEGFEFQVIHLKDVATVRVNIKIEVVKRYCLLSTSQTL